jgi:hypothetical protein
MKRIYFAFVPFMMILACLPLYSQKGTDLSFNSSDAYLQFIMAKKHNQRNIIDLDSVHEMGYTAAGYQLGYRHLHTSDYTTGIFTRLTMWDLGAGWTNLELTTYEADTAAYQVRFAFYDSYWPGYGWFLTPFAAGTIQYDTLYREISDSVEMAPVFMRSFSEHSYDALGRRDLTERKRSLRNLSTQTWGPKHYFDSLRIAYHGNTDSIELKTRYYLVTPGNTVQTWYTYLDKLVVQKEDKTNLTGSFTENSLTQFLYDQDNDMVLRLYRRWDDSTQSYQPYDSIIYRYYSPPLAQFFYVDWLVNLHYPEFGVATKLVREIERFAYHPVDGYRPSMKYVYYYNVPGLATPPATTSDPGSTVYPNPANDHINVHSNHTGQQGTLELYSSDGRLLIKTSLHDTNTRVNTSHLTPGVYLYRISNGETLKGKGRLVIMR